MGLCCSIEIYCGKQVATDNLITRTVLRNVAKVADSSVGKRMLVTDNYYSSVALSKELLDRNYYHVGTVRTNRKGWPKDFAYTWKKRPNAVPRGIYRIATCDQIPGLIAATWTDTRSVNFLATGCGTEQKLLRRKEKNGSRILVTCPELVEAYTENMGGVDTHDQLRLQRYSLQKATRFRKYYKALFLAVVDMATVNGYVVHRHTQKEKGACMPKHAEYLQQLHEQLLAVTHFDFQRHPLAENLATTALPSTEHELTQSSDMYKNKRRQYLCKVCSAYSDGPQRSAESSYWCEACTEAFGGRVALCNRARHGNLTCSQIWHDTWRNGTAIPPELRKKIRFRKRQVEQ